MSDGSSLAMNVGSSSIKFAVYDIGAEPVRRLSGRIDRIGLTGTALFWQVMDAGSGEGRVELPAGATPTDFLLDWLAARPELADLRAVGHRVVHGMDRSEPARITPELMAELRRLTPYAPDHLPRELDLIEAVRVRYPRLPQVACFDTAFHRAMPALAKLLPLPRRYHAEGVQRYGFHGLSYAFLLEELSRVAGPDDAAGRVILAHLGNGASLAAVRNGRSIDTSMGFTPAAGLMMSTRTGDLDPGVAAFLLQTEQMTATQFERMVNHESGLLGVSELGSDMRDLLEREPNDVRAAEAVGLFCYGAKKWIGAFAAALGGLDTLVFSAGVGEHSAPVRARVCDGLGFLGVRLHEERNAGHAPVISADGNPVTVRVIHTDEERMIARSVSRLLDPSDPITHHDE